MAFYPELFYQQQATISTLFYTGRPDMSAVHVWLITLNNSVAAHCKRKMANCMVTGKIAENCLIL
jgi:hypothetical protein